MKAIANGPVFTYNMLQMNSRGRLAFLVLPWFLVALLAGCASKRPLVSTWREAQFSPVRSDTIALTLRPHPNPEENALGQLLRAELKHEGFHLVPLDQADYLLTYALEDDSTATYWPEVGFTPPQHSFYVAAAQGVFPGGQPSIPVSDIYRPPMTVVYHSKGIRLYLFTNPKTHAGRFVPVWNGCIEAGPAISAERQPLLLRTLLGYFGRDYHGRVVLGQ